MARAVTGPRDLLKLFSAASDWTNSTSLRRYWEQTRGGSNLPPVSPPNDRPHRLGGPDTISADLAHCGRPSIPRCRGMWRTGAQLNLSLKFI